MNNSFVKIFNKEKEGIYVKIDEELFLEDSYSQSIKGDLAVIKKGSYTDFENFNNSCYQV